MLFKSFFKQQKTSPEPEPQASRSKKGKLTHNVYVIELSKRVWDESKKFRDANPQFRAGSPCLYVGMTAHSPNERFTKHIKGARNKKGYKISSRIVEKYGLYLRPSLYSNFNPLSRADAAALERNLANSLKKRGYAVWWN